MGRSTLSERTAMKHPSVENFLAAIGKTHDTAEVQNIFSHLDITEKDLGEYLKSLPERRLWVNMDDGMQLDFEDIGVRRGIPYHDIGEGPWVLTGVIMWAAPESRKPYGGPMPLGIQFSMSREEVGLKVPSEKLMSSARVDAWVMEGYELVVNYHEESQSIRCVSIRAQQD